MRLNLSALAYSNYYSNPTRFSTRYRNAYLWLYLVGKELEIMV